jgi:hypothetical protein
MLPVLLILALAACSGPAPAAPVATTAPATAGPAVTEPAGGQATGLPAATEPAGEPATAEPAVPQPTEAPVATESGQPQAPLSFAAATFRDEALGIEFEYPAAWTVTDLGQLGSRGSGAQFTEEGQPRLNLTLYRWDPTDDLDAYVEHRKQAWGSSGFSLLSEEELPLPGGSRAGRFVIETPDSIQALFFFTPLGDRYLELSGEGDIELLTEITGTVRPLEAGSQSHAAEPFDCTAAAEGTAEWAACNVMAGLRSRNLSALHGFMSDPFTIGYWGSEGRSASPAEITAELAEARLPADPATPMSFTTERNEFPPLAGMQLETMFGPDLDVALVIYSEGWGPDGAGSALLYIVQDESGQYRWHSLAYSEAHFDE